MIRALHPLGAGVAAMPVRHLLAEDFVHALLRIEVDVPEPLEYLALPSELFALIAHTPEDLRVTYDDGKPLDAVALRGPEPAMRRLRVQGRGELVVALLTPAGYLATLGPFLTREPARRPQRFDCEQLPAGLVSLRLTVLGAAASSGLSEVIVQWLSRRLAGAGLLAGGAARVGLAARAMLAGEALPDVDELARRVKITRRQLHRDFRTWLGIAPSELLRLARLQRALIAIAQGEALADISIAKGYADQSHMAREVKSLTHMRPSRLAESAGLARGASGLIASGRRLLAISASLHQQAQA